MPRTLNNEDAVKIALENNYAIKIAANELTIGKTNVSIGNAGMLPRATASIIDNNNIINLHKLILMELLTALTMPKNNSLNYGVNCVLTALKMFKTRAAKELQKQGEAQLKLTISTKLVMSMLLILIWCSSN
jgi:outer membrane protein TolC